MSGETQLAQACQRCWRRKQKCGRERPTCAQCSAAGATCVGRIWGRVLGDGTSFPMEDPASARSVIEQMKARIAILEQHPQGSPIAQNHNAHDSGQVFSSSLSDQQTNESALRTDHGAEKSTANEVEYLSVAAVAGHDRQDVLVDEGPNFAILVSEAAKLSPRITSNQTLDLIELQTDLWRSCHCDLNFFINIFHRGVGQLFPCISQQSSLDALTIALHSDHTDATPEQHYSREEAILIVCLTVSLGILNSVHYSSARQQLRRLKEHAMNLLSEGVRDTSDAKAVRFLLLASLLCLYEFEKAAAWHLIGLAFTKAISAGLHRFKTPVDDDEDVSELFWTLYKLDRIFAIVLDTPFSMEDSDMTIQLPQTTWSQGFDSSIIALKHFSAWTIHGVHMISSWRGQAAPNLLACYSSLSYWRETCTDLITSSQSAKDSDSLSVSMAMRATKAQMTCRALVYLLLKASDQPSQPSLLDRVGSGLEREVPELLTEYRAILDAQILGPTLIDAFDIIGAVIAYICSRQFLSRSQSQSGLRPRTAAIGVAGMRLVTSCMDILRRVSDRHAPILQLQEILWGFLSALEDGSQLTDTATSGSTRANTQAISEGLSRSSVSVPRHLVQLMHRALG